MTCSACEERREWIRKHTQRAKLRMQKLLQQLGASNVGNNKQPKSSSITALINSHTALINSHAEQNKVSAQIVDQNNDLIAELIQDDEEIESSSSGYLDG